MSQLIVQGIRHFTEGPCLIETEALSPECSIAWDNGHVAVTTVDRPVDIAPPMTKRAAFYDPSCVGWLEDCEKPPALARLQPFYQGTLMTDASPFISTPMSGYPRNRVVSFEARGEPVLVRCRPGEEEKKIAERAEDANAYLASAGDGESISVQYGHAVVDWSTRFPDLRELQEDWATIGRITRHQGEIWWRERAALARVMTTDTLSDSQRA